MKKSSLALALLAAFAGAASAQTVTLYGRASFAINSESGGDRSLQTDRSITRFRDGGEATGVGGSRWGLRASEDLGGGLSANAVLESGFDLDAGTSRQGNRLFGRQVWVSLASKSLGEVRFGRQLTATRTVLGIAEPSGDGELKLRSTRALSVGAGFTNPGTGSVILMTDFGGRVDNQIAYFSPKFSGFQVVGQLGLAENVSSSAARYQALSLIYGAGPLNAGLSYEAYDGFGETYNKTITLGANYNFGVVRLHAGLQNVSDASAPTSTTPQTAAANGPSTNYNDASGYVIGAYVPFGKAELRVSYASTDFERDVGNFAGTTDNELDLTKLGVSLRYNLSKRTLVYTGFNLYGGDLEDFLVIKRELILFGMSHSF